MIIIEFPHAPRPARTQHARRRANCPRSIHTYRRALMRRMGLSCAAGRPAAIFDALARELLAARAS